MVYAMASLTTREIVLLGILGVVGVITGFYHFYFTPQQDRLADLNNQLVRVQQEYSDANMRILQATVMAGQLDEGVEEEWELAMSNIREYFNEPESQRIMQRIVYPHVAPDANINFTIGDSAERDGFVVTNTTLSFTATNRAELESVVRQLSELDHANRIVIFNVSTADDDFGVRGQLNVSMTIEFLTRYFYPQVEEVEEE